MYLKEQRQRINLSSLGVTSIASKSGIRTRVSLKSQTVTTHRSPWKTEGLLFQELKVL